MSCSNMPQWEKFVKATIGNKYKPPGTPPQKPKETEVANDNEQSKKAQIHG